MNQRNNPSEERDPFTAIMQANGHNFHCKVANHFRDNDWTVLLSPYYLDNATDRSREVDLLCEKVWAFRNRFVTQHVRVQLIVECKYSGREMVFWFDKCDAGKVSDEIYRQQSFLKDNANVASHHYKGQSNGHVAKLFASGTDPQGRKDEREPFYVALSQCLGALAQVHNFGILVDITSKGNCVTLRYPVILCSSFDKCRRTNIAQPGTLEKVTSNFLLEVEHAYMFRTPNGISRALRQYSLIDVVEFDRFSEFFDALEREVQVAGALAS